MNGAQRQKKLKMALEESSPRTSTIKMTNQGSLVSSSTQLRISNIHRSSLPGLLPSPQPIKKLQKLVPRAGISIKTPDQLNQALPKEAKIVPLPKTNGKPVVFVKKPENNVASQKALQLPAQVVVRKILPKPKVPSAVEFLQVATTSSNPINGAPDKFFYRGPGLRIPARPEANRISLQASPAALSKLTAQMNNAGKEAASQEIRISMKETTEYIKALENGRNF